MKQGKVTSLKYLLHLFFNHYTTKFHPHVLLLQCKFIIAQLSLKMLNVTKYCITYPDKILPKINGTKITSDFNLTEN